MAMPTFLPRHPPAHVGRAGCSACAARCPQDLLGSQGQRTLSPSLSPTLSQHRLVMGFTGLLSAPSNPPLGSEELGGSFAPLQQMHLLSPYGQPPSSTQLLTISSCCC